MKVYIDGSFFDDSEAKISIFNYGFLYGYGVYEYIRIYNGRIFRLKEHLERLLYSARTISLIIKIEQSEIEKAIIQTLTINKLINGYIKLIVTIKGDNRLQYNQLKYEYDTTSIIIIAIDTSVCLYTQSLYINGINVITLPLKNVRHDSLDFHIKSINYLNNMLYKMEAIQHNVHDSILLNSEGYIIGCSSSNIFIIKNGIMYTPSIVEGCFDGITRETVIELSRNKLNLIVKETRINIYNLYNADECFITGTIIELIPVVKVNFKYILSGKPGPITIKLMREFKNLVMSTGTPIEL
ncbi:MAG: aminotransferase class IV [Endomicrobium sp.]|jgi:branched-chain amino acid aminotransferase|nr:aminotransferase class IV [Endomicrobium sp.]